MSLNEVELPQVTFTGDAYARKGQQIEWSASQIAQYFFYGTGIFHGLVVLILREICLINISAEWAPRLLTVRN